MEIKSIHFKNHPCFKTEWAGFDRFAPVNVIIGKNNTGKSHLLSLVKSLTGESLGKIPWDILASCVLHESTLKRAFLLGHSSGDLTGDHWEEHGRFLIGDTMTWVKEQGTATLKTDPERIDQATQLRRGLDYQNKEARRKRLIGLASGATHWFEPDPENRARV